MSSNFRYHYDKAVPQVVRKFRKVYVFSFNLYAYYWLYKIIWVLPFEWENLLSWFFAVAGMYYFILDNRAKLGIENYHKGAE